MLVLKLLVSVFIFASCSSSSIRGRSRPNIIFMLIDDLGWNDVGFNNNNAINTPVLDNLVKEGVKLDNYYVQPICSPSRSVLMTGRSLHHIGLQHLVIWPCQSSSVPLEMPTVADKLKEAGYATHMVGKWHLGFAQDAMTPTRRGFDSFYGFYNGAEDYYLYGGCYTNRMQFDTPAPGFGGRGMCGLDLRDNENRVNPRSINNTYATFTHTQKAIDVIKNHNHEQPLFLYLAWQAVHFPLEVPQSYIEPYVDIKDDQRRVRAGMTSNLDEAIGKVMQALKDNGFSDNTIVIISTDNGGETDTGGNNWPLRGMKISNWEGGVRGVGIVHSTDHKLLPRNNYVNKKLIHISDWYPTLVHLAGGSTEGLDLDGYDVWDAISTGERSPRTELLHNIDPLWPLSGERRPNSPFDNRVQAAIRVGNWKLLTGDPYNGSWVAPWENPSLKSVLDPNRQVGDQVKNIWLFDIENDPNEQHDLSDQYPEKVDELLARLAFYNQSAVTPNYPPDDAQCNPALRGGFWGPWLPDPVSQNLPNVF